MPRVYLQRNVLTLRTIWLRRKADAARLSATHRPSRSRPLNASQVKLLTK